MWDGNGAWKLMTYSSDKGISVEWQGQWHGSAARSWLGGTGSVGRQGRGWGIVKVVATL
jgi:hypothetical protein